MLIANIIDLKNVLGGVQKTMLWPTWEPFVRQARLKYIEPAIGTDFYAELSALAAPNAVQQGLLDRLRAAEGYFAYLIGFPQLVVVTGDSGIAVSTPTGTQAMTKWLYVSAKKDLANNASSHLEDALAFLEANANSFSTWKASTLYTVTKSLLIASATQLTESFPAVKNSRRLWLELRGHVGRVQVDVIRPLIGEDFYAHLLTKNAAGTAWTEEEKEALRLLRYALAHHAVAAALPYLNLNEDFRLVSETDGIVNEAVMSGEKLALMKADCDSKAAGYASTLKKYLDDTASATVLPSYYNSPTRTSTARKPYQLPKNDPSKPFFRL